MGKFQRAEAAGLISFLVCAVLAIIAMTVYMNVMPAIWQVSQRLFTMASGIVAACSMGAFIVGYLRTHRNLIVKRWIRIIKHIFEITALSTIYGATMFLMSFALLSIINGIVGRSVVNSYLPVFCSALSGIVGYATLVQAELLEAKTVASLLPLFVISGAATAGLTSDDPYWYNNNFSQLGDRTTFAASMFNATLILAGICIIITSYFAVTEFVEIQHEALEEELRSQQQYSQKDTQSDTKHKNLNSYAKNSNFNLKNNLKNNNNSNNNSNHKNHTIKYFYIRTTIMATLLILGGVAFIGIGTFRYTPHPFIHDLCARGVTLLVGAVLVGLPLLAPQLSKTFYIASDLAILLTSWAGTQWLRGYNTLTNVEALSCLLFLGWIIVFSRQVAALQSDRLQAKLRNS